MTRCRLLLILTLGVAPRFFLPAQGDEVPEGTLPQRYHLHLGAGYLHTFEELTTVWESGFNLETSFVYKPWSTLGLELGGTLGYTGMTGEMKNKVLTYEPSTERNRTRESSGGGLYGVSFGPRYYYRIPQSRFIISAGAGGHYCGEKESGMDNIDGYSPRWTFGWGYYALAAVQRMMGTGRIPFQLGAQVRYTEVRAKVNDFYYDRVYGVASYDAIPGTYVQDRRITVSLDLAFCF